jgi:3-keto-disaccharide hydrolase
MDTEINRRAALLALMTLPAGMRVASAGSARRQAAQAWTPLFNGGDLTGWETFLGLPHSRVDVPGQPRNPQGEYLNPLGVDNDPKRVFSVVAIDGAPALRVSGEIYGALTTRAEYDNYHLRLEFKWGEKKWPPREQAIRDSGCCYHAVGPHGASYGFWMQSCEFQIQEGECGDFYSLAGVIVDAEADPVKPGDPRTELTYRKGAPKVVGHTRRIVKDRLNEKPYGEWNTLDLYCLGQTSVHVVNGTPNMVLSGLRRTVDGQERPLSKGRIQLQSEGAEVFYRNIRIRSIQELPFR